MQNKLGKFIKGNKPWNTGKKLPYIPHLKSRGRIPWNKNKHFVSSGSFQPKEKHWNWKGGRIIVNGYVYIKKPEHPNCNIGGYIFEHRLVMEKHLKRYLKSNEWIHHRNGIKDDNQIKNLQIILVKAVHKGNIKCPFCKNEFAIR